VAYLLRLLIVLMVGAMFFTTALALGWVNFHLGHIAVSIPAYLYTLFAQAFVMFYFIGVARLVGNVHMIVHSGSNLHELFENPPEDLTPYRKQINRYQYEADTCKRQTVPWSILIIVLGMLAFLLGGAYDTALVSRATHSGVVYGFLVAMTIGFFRQWYYLGKSHLLLRKLKTLFDIPDAAM
jgi:ABC-type multidrug transport system fused ATPase/permease subunit